MQTRHAGPLSGRKMCGDIGLDLGKGHPVNPGADKGIQFRVGFNPRRASHAVRGPVWINWRQVGLWQVGLWQGLFSLLHGPFNDPFKHLGQTLPADSVCKLGPHSLTSVSAPAISSRQWSVSVSSGLIMVTPQNADCRPDLRALSGQQEIADKARDHLRAV